jgi:hypothetical protein
MSKAFVKFNKQYDTLFMNKHVLIFCQSPKDLKYTLDIYTKNIGVGNRCSIIVREVTGVFEFIKTLNLDLVLLTFMKTFSMKSPVGLLNQLQEAKTVVGECNKLKFDDVYFFSNLFDVSTPYIIKRISSQNVYFYDHFKHQHCVVKNVKIFEYIRAFVIRLIFSLKTSVVDDQRVLRIDFEDEITEKLASEDVVVDLKYMLKPISLKEKSVLFLDFNDKLGNLPHADYYFGVFYQFFTSLGYSIAVKGHPRLGLSDYISDYNCSILDASIPSEFIDISGFKFIFSVCSASLVSFPKDVSFSLIGYFDVKNDTFYVDYLKRMGMTDRQFISSEKEMKSRFVE